MTEKITNDQIDKEILPLLSKDAKASVRGMAMEYFLGMTGSDEGKIFISGNTKYLEAIVEITGDEHDAIAKDAYLCLVNLSTDDETSLKLLTLSEHPNFASDLLKYILKEDSPHADIACMILSNLSRWENSARKIVDIITEHQDCIGFDQIIFALCKKDFNKNAKLHYLGPLLSNLTQIKEARKYVLDKERCVIQRLLPFTQYKESLVRRGGIIGTLRNCCFETEFQDWLISEEIDILPRLLLPLAGPEEFDDEDMDLLPPELQYLEPDKEREPDPDVRKMLVESIMQLCATKKSRLYIKEKNTYVIMREYHKWETDPACNVAIEKLIYLLISDEPEPGMENLREVQIPEHIQASFDKEAAQTQKEVEEETKKLEQDAMNQIANNSESKS